MKGNLVLFCALIVFLLPAWAAERIVASTPMELRGNLPFVHVMINGKGPFTFGIDTCTGGQALISSELAQQLHLPISGEAEIGDPSGQNGHTVAVVEIDLLKLGGLEFKNVAATEYPGQMQEKTDGILGFVLFRDYLLKLDYPMQTVTLADGSLSAANGNDILSFRMPNDVPIIELNVGGRKIDAHVDSRGRGLSFPQDFAANLKFSSAPVVIGRGRTVSNEFEVKGAQLATDIHFGGYTFSKPFVTIHPLIPVANFGSEPLRNFAVTFDQKNKLVRFESALKTITIEPPKPRPSVPRHSD